MASGTWSTFRKYCFLLCWFGGWLTNEWETVELPGRMQNAPLNLYFRSMMDHCFSRRYAAQYCIFLCYLSSSLVRALAFQTQIIPNSKEQKPQHHCQGNMSSLLVPHKCFSVRRPRSALEASYAPQLLNTVEKFRNSGACTWSSWRSL